MGRNTHRSARRGHGADARAGCGAAPRRAPIAARARRRGGGSRVVSRPLGAALAVAIGLAAATAPLFAQGEPSITRVAIEGNVRVEEDAVRVHLRTQTGQPFECDTLDRDIRAVYAMGFFDQVDADVSPAGENHVAVTFRVNERALVRTVKIEGTKKLKREEVEGALKVRPHTILDPEKARQGIEAAKKLYVDKGYLDAEIAYRTAPVGENEVDPFYTVKEESPVRVPEAASEGNRAFSARKPRRA